MAYSELDYCVAKGFEEIFELSHNAFSLKADYDIESKVNSMQEALELVEAGEQFAFYELGLTDNERSLLASII